MTKPWIKRIQWKISTGRMMSRDESSKSYHDTLAMQSTLIEMTSPIRTLFCMQRVDCSTIYFRHSFLQHRHWDTSLSCYRSSRASLHCYSYNPKRKFLQQQLQPPCRNSPFCPSKSSWSAWIFWCVIFPCRRCCRKIFWSCCRCGFRCCHDSETF